MNRRDPGHLEARTAAGAFVLAAAVLVIALIAGASVARAALLAFVPLALGAGAMFAAWRRAADRNVALEASLRKTHGGRGRGGGRAIGARARGGGGRAARHRARTPTAHGSPRGGGARPATRAH